MSAGNGRNFRWLQQHQNYSEAGWCLMWPFGRHKDGYGILGIDYKMKYAHRIMCELAHGAPATPDLEAAHSCGRGHEGCVNPLHLSWKTKTENRREAGSRPRKKLDPTRAAAIRALRGLETEDVTAARYGVSEVTIRQIQSGRIWRGKGQCDREFTDAEIQRIRAAKGMNGAQTQLAKEFGVSHGIIHRIMHRKTWALVPEAT